MNSMVEPSPGVMEALRTRTTEHHERAEKHPFQKALVSGRLPRPAYRENIAQLMFIHAELEARLRTLRESDPRVAAIIGDNRFHSGTFESELRFLGMEPGAAQALPEVTGLAEELRTLAAGEPLAALGMLYVLEGSTNGGVFIAKAVTRAYGLTGPEGTRWLNPHGEGQRPAWIAFKQAMDGAGFTPGEIEAMVEAARWMFDAVSRVGSAVLAAHPEAGVSGPSAAR